jgi:hypothetical protein
LFTTQETKVTLTFICQKAEVVECRFPAEVATNKKQLPDNVSPDERVESI